VSDQVLNIEESEEMKDKEPRQKGDGRACGEEDELGIDGDHRGTSQETMVPNLDIRQTETELLEEAFNKRRKLPTAEAPEIRQTPIDELGRKPLDFLSQTSLVELLSLRLYCPPLYPGATTAS
jgi:hypothetical protein